MGIQKTNDYKVIIRRRQIDVCNNRYLVKWSSVSSIVWVILMSPDMDIQLNLRHTGKLGKGNNSGWSQDSIVTDGTWEFQNYEISELKLSWLVAFIGVIWCGLDVIWCGLIV